MACHAQRVVVPVAAVEPLGLSSADAPVGEPVVEPVAEPEAPIEVPLPVVAASVEGVVLAVEPDRLPEPVVDDVSALVVGAGAGVVVVVLDVEVSVVATSRWQAVSEAAASRARTAQRAMEMVVMWTLLERFVGYGGQVDCPAGTLLGTRYRRVGSG